jgi:hypothetical protein
MRLRGQYTFVIGGLVTLSLGLLGSALLAEQRRYAREVGVVAAANLAESLERQIERHGIAMATALAERLVAPLYHNDYRLITREAAEQRSHPDVIYATVVDAEGVMIRESGVAGDESTRLDSPWVLEALASHRAVSRRDSGVLRVAAWRPPR